MRQTEKNVSPFSNKARNAYVIERITDSLIKLLRDKSIRDISIIELCDHAGIGRASFYRNFGSKEDILRGYINKIFKEWMNEADKKKNRPLNESLGLLFSHFEKYRDFYSLLNKRNLVYLLKDVIIGLYGPKPEHSKIEAYARAYVAYSLYGWVEVWFQRGMQETAKEIEEMFQVQSF
ncbi:TetR/AcrR family transcriptional regulator [Enterococcus casseliflavus]|jgi:Transcriptional regulator|uniref:TetR/AcrR family transcriptional regulator n=1 Tax=Enterococcus casseliflavus TaxID=37734 RepID=UPI0022E00D50|nr:TetR/AcrR family transcriptional regulator [Enterococcus casseliflavus]